MKQPPAAPPARDRLVVTTELLRRAKDGDQAALESLIARYLPPLRSWASGRLPTRARSLFDTGDLVQETLLRTIERLDHIEVRGPGGFEAYVRTAILNRIQDQIRWANRRPVAGDAQDVLLDAGPSPLEMAIGADLVARYERALATLTEEEQRLLHLKIELDYDYDEIAAAAGRPSSGAARMAVMRALRHLAEAMGHGA